MDEHGISLGGETSEYLTIAGLIEGVSCMYHSYWLKEATKSDDLLGNGRFFLSLPIYF